MMHREQNKTRLVAENLERKIRHAEWTPGMRLPSTRLLASEFECSTQVIVDAFDMLEQKRLVERKLRSGVFVRENPLFSNIEVGFLFSDTSQHKNNQFLNAMRRMADAPFLEPGFNFTLRSFSMPPHVNETVFHDELLRFIDRMNLDVLVLLAPFLSVKDVEFCRGLNIPVIFLGDFSDEASAMLPHHQISNDNFAYATIAFRKFASQISAAEVMLLSGSRQHYFYREFYEGFIHAANSTGIRVDLRELPIHFSNFSLADQIRVLRELFADVLTGKHEPVPCFNYLDYYLRPVFDRLGLRDQLQFYCDSVREEDYALFFRRVYRMIRSVVSHPETVQVIQSAFDPDVRLQERI